MKYYEILTPDDEVNGVVIAETSGKAKSKFIKGETIPFFQGWDNSDWEFIELKARRLKELDEYSPDDSFNILKSLILKEYWYFEDTNGKNLSVENYSDKKLRRYLATGEIE